MNTAPDAMVCIEKEKARKAIKEKIAVQIEQLFSEQIEKVTDINSAATAELFYEIEKMESKLLAQECKNNPQWASCFYQGIDIDELHKAPQEKLDDYYSEVYGKIDPVLGGKVLYFNCLIALLGSSIGAVVMLYLFNAFVS